MSSDSTATAAYPPPDSASALVRVLDEYVAALQAGRAPERAEVLRAHPELANQLDSCLSALEFIHRAERPAEAPPQLGDFRIVREIGRGGMGVVYEAEQVSLKRRVALKVLRFGGAADAQAMERFQREAETVGRLHHTNIVPVFAVGSQAGVHFYAMQFIDGLSLDKAPQRSSGEVIRWGLQAAEALAYAHARGVIHRDIKPSNLLLDNEGTVWLTDFGLAKRVDEVTMTAAGALLGTPRYMSPEQASFVQKPVDHRSDIYSLGATLYELTTGRPLFEADTPQKIIAQILEREPAPPRRVRPDLPRDIETVLLKCLAKEPAARYASAADLADDLRAVLDGRPVKARRPSLRERAGRWVKRQRRALALTLASAAVATLLALGAVYGQRQYAEQQLGQVLLTTDGPHLKAEVFDEHDRPAAAPFTVPGQDWLALTEGRYRVRLSRSGALSETLDLDVQRGNRKEFKVELGGRQMFGAAQVGPWDTFAYLNLGDQADLVVLEARRGIRRLTTGAERPVWEIAWQPGSQAGSEGYGLAGEIFRLLEERPHPPAAPPPDVDGDGTRDLVWAGGYGLLAMSGSTGKKLWFQRWQPVLPPEAQDQKLRSEYGNGGGSHRAVGRPVMVDVDGDGMPDPIVVVASRGERFVTTGKPQRRYDSAAQAWVEAVAAKTGKPLWRLALSTVPARREDGREPLAPGELVEVDGRPLVLVQDGAHVVAIDAKTGRFAWPAYDLGGEPARDPDDEPRPHGFSRRVPPSGRQVLDVAGPVLLALVERTLHALDLATGQPRWPPRTLPGVPLRPPQFLPRARPGLLALYRGSTDSEYLDLVASDWGDGREQWRQSVRACWPPTSTRPYERTPATPDWPVLVDAGGTCVVLPDQPPRVKPKPDVAPGTFHLDFSETSKDWAGVTLIDAASGARRWTRKFKVDIEGLAGQCNHFIAGPDLDGDGRAELFIASFAQPVAGDPRYHSTTHQHLFVTALSGHDGGTLWWWREKMRLGGEIARLGWWQTGPDGLPLLLVAFDSDRDNASRESPSATYVLRASDGKLAHLLAGVGRPHLVDLDGDGILDLHALVRPANDAWRDKPLSLHATRGAPAEVWRRLGRYQLVQDLDGDGVVDAISNQPDATIAFSGRDGRQLWRTAPLDLDLAPPLPLGDLDGDGVADLLTSGVLKRHAASGRTGQPLWPTVADAKDELGAEGSIGMGHTSLLPPPTLLDLHGDGRPTILYAYTLDFGDTAKASARQSQCWLAAVDARTNQVRWKRPVGARGDKHTRLLSLGGSADLDSDGRPELVVLFDVGDAWAVQALRGHDGTTLWQHDLTYPRELAGFHEGRAPIALVAAGGPDEPAVFVLERHFEVLERKEIATGASDKRQFRIGPSCYRVQGLRGRDGAVAWEYRFQEDAPRTLMMGNAEAYTWNHRAVLARLKDVGPAVCLYTVQPDNWLDSATAHFVVLDRAGAARQRLQRPFSPSYSSGINIGALAAVDVDGDGHDELLWTLHEQGRSANHLHVARGGFADAQLLWRRPDARATGFLPGTKEHAPRVFSHERGRLAVLEGPSGRLLGSVGNAAVPPPLSAGTTVRLLATREDSTGCCLVPGSRNDLRTVSANAAPDPRLRLWLPWVEYPVIPYALKAARYALVLIALPLAMLVAARRRRSWRWALACLASVGGAAAALAGGWLSAQGGLEDLPVWMYLVSRTQWLFAPIAWIGITLGFRETTAVLGLPLVVFAGLVLWSLIQRRWQRLAVLAALVPLLAAVTAACLLAGDDRRYDESQWYDWERWYDILVPGVYYTGVVLIVIGVLRFAANLWRARRPRSPEARG